MKKKLIDLFKTFLLPSISVGVVVFFFSCILFNNKKDFFSNRDTLHLVFILSFWMAIGGGAVIWLVIKMNKRLKESYDQMDLWCEKIEMTDSITDLESYIEMLKTFKNSSKCPSPTHVRYANEIILIAKEKIETIKKVK
jgi:hypothetical protein